MARSPLPTIRGTQIGLSDPGQVDTIKADMLAGRFAFEEPRAIISGIIDERGVIFVKDGHHRMVAALEIYRETNNPEYALELLRRGNLARVTYTPHEGRPLPARHRWGAFRHWLGW